MNYMHCTTCRKIVQANATGICTGCQSGFVAPPEGECYIPDPSEIVEAPEENWGIIPLKEEMRMIRERITIRQAEERDALQEHRPKKIHVREHARDGEEMGSPHAKEQKTPQEKEPKTRRRKKK